MAMGGACFTNDADLAKRLRSIRVHGQQGRYHHVELGINGRMDTLQAAMMLPKLAIFDAEITMRQNHAAHYNAKLSNFVKTPFIESYNTSVYAQYTIEVENRDLLQAFLAEVGIPSSIHYPKSLHEQPSFTKQYKAINHFPLSEAAAGRVLSLPFHPYLTTEQIEFVTERIKEFCYIHSLQVV